MDYSVKVLTPENLEKVYQFEIDRLQQNEEDEIERNLKSWVAPWRKESLEHYVKTGWSFIVFHPEKDKKVVGYSLGQAFVFFQGHTQTLWVEHISGENLKVEEFLVDVVYRWAKDKHLQRVLIAEGHRLRSVIESFNGTPSPCEDWEIKTTKG